MITFFAEHWIALVVSFIVTCLFASLQWHFFVKNKRMIASLCDFFLDDVTYYKTKQHDEVCLVALADDETHSDFNTLIKEINLYVLKSVGTADFNIIQNKTERKIESLYEHATAELSFPTYIGLMGTFMGTFIGLVGFLVSGNDMSDENKVTNLIAGVLVSMTTSLIGLVLTTYSNHIAALSKKQLDERKNSFLDFVQLDLIPQLQTTIKTLQQTMEGFVPKFDVVINNFERTFSTVISRFKSTFDECTDNFGTEFRANSSLIAKTVSTLNKSIEHITANVENQRKLLEELRSEKMFDTLQQFVDAAEVFQTSTYSIEAYNNLLSNLMVTTQQVIIKQDEFSKSLQIPQELVVKLKSLLDRISTFEQSVNAVGKDIAQAEMLGNKELTLIQRHLESLEEKKQLADRFLDTSNDELKEIFTQQKKLVKAIFVDYQQQLDDQRNELSSFVRETLQIISKKKVDLLNHLENAFDVSHVNAMFSHLKTLPEIAEKLNDVEQIVVKEKDLKQQFESLLLIISQLETALNAASALHVETIVSERTMLSADIKAATIQNQEAVANTLQEENQQNRLQMGSVVDKFVEVADDANSNLKNIHNELESKLTDMLRYFDETNASSRQMQIDIADLGVNVEKGALTIRSVIEGQTNEVEGLIQKSSNQAQKNIIDTLTAAGNNNVGAVVDGLNESVKKTLDGMNQAQKNMIDTLTAASNNSVGAVVDGLNESVKKTLDGMNRAQKNIIDTLTAAGNNNVDVVVDGLNKSVKKTFGEMLDGISKANGQG